MVTGTLATAGYWTDDNAWGADKFNSKGYFEEPLVHAINDAILLPVVDSPFHRLPDNHPSRQAASNNHGWLGVIPEGAELTLNPELTPQIQRCLSRQPFCLKDVRFSYTLNIWRPFLMNTKFVCVFRHPLSTIKSLVHMWNHREHLSPLNINEAYAEQLWNCIYSHILNRKTDTGDWLFLHYDQLFDPKMIDRLSDFVGAKIDHTFPDKRMKKSVPTGSCSTLTRSIYAELCLKSGFSS